MGYIRMFTTENLYSNTVYNAQKTATLSYYDAAISELTQTIDLESKQKADEYGKILYKRRNEAKSLRRRF